MSTMAVIGRDFGERINDPALASTPFWKFLIFANKAIRDLVARTDCLVAKQTITGAIRLTVVDYTALSADTIVTTVDGTATTLIIAAAASNTAMATAIAVQLDAITGVEAYSSGAYVYALGIDEYMIDSMTTSDTTNLVIEDDGYDTLTLPSILTNLRNVRNIYDTTNEILYAPLSTQQHDRTLLDSNFVGYTWNVDSSYNLSLKVAGANPTSQDQFVIDYWTWGAALTLHSESAPGVLAEWDEAVINRSLYYFYMTQAKMDMANICAGLFERDVRAIREQLRSHGEPQEQRLFYQWH